MSALAMSTAPSRLAFGNGGPSPYLLLLLMLCTVALMLIAPDAFSQVRIPGTDESGKLEAAGSLLRILDTSIFTWGARLCAGTMIFSAGLNLKEQRFGIAFICIIGALVIGTAPMWVKNIFEIGGGSVFGSLTPISEYQRYV